MTDDIVAELDRWLAETVNEIYGPTPVMVQRARAEIVALRNAHAEALEEAAQIVKEEFNPETSAKHLFGAALRCTSIMAACIGRIRALKDY
jgi:hypothetical protein